MDFYSFRFGDMKMVQADAASQKLMAVEMGLGFRRPDRHTVEALNLTVHIPHDANQTVTAHPARGVRRRGEPSPIGRRLLRREGSRAALRGDGAHQSLRRHLGRMIKPPSPAPAGGW